MAYTSGQQAQIDTANAQLASAKSAMDNAYGVAKPLHDSLFKCVAGKGTTSNCSDGQPLGAGKYPAFGNLGSSGDCKICNSLKDCKSDCCNESTCVGRVNAYNSAIGPYNTAKGNYESAKANLQTILDSVGQQVQNDPEVLLEKDKTEKEASVAKLKWAFFGIMILSILGIGTYMALRTQVKKAYIIGGGLGLIALLYLFLFGIGQDEE